MGDVKEKEKGTTRPPQCSVPSAPALTLIDCPPFQCDSLRLAAVGKFHRDETGEETSQCIGSFPLPSYIIAVAIQGRTGGSGGGGGGNGTKGRHLRAKMLFGPSL